MASDLQSPSNEPLWLLGGFVKTRIQTLSFVATLAVGMVSGSSVVLAQTASSTSPDQQTSQQQPSPDSTTADQTPQAPTQQAQQPPAQAPEIPPATQQPPTAKMPDQAQASTSDSDSPPAASGVQAFTGTVVKSGDKYMLKDDSGQTYNIDHQDEVAKFEGKHIRVHGTLDDKGAIQLK